MGYNKINMDPSEYYDFEDRRYVNPTLSRDEQLGFVDTLRDTVGRNTAQINTQTQALGSNLPSIQGGLTGLNGYFAQRYQTAPMEAQVNNLRATAQAKALNDLMTNYQNQAANRYNQAYRSYNKRHNTPTTTNPDTTADDPFTKSPLDDPNSDLNAQAPGTYYPKGAGSGTFYVTPDGYGKVVDASGRITKTDDPNYAKASNGYYYDISNISTPVWAELLGPTLAGSGVTYEQWLSQWKANQAAKQADNGAYHNGTIGGW